MKIMSLDFIKFGPFTGQNLDLSAGNHGLHVIYGNNEAGKSSALRAIDAFLYGIPGRTGDAFIHPYDELRVGGRLCHSTGSEIEFIRRKGNVGTILSYGGERLDDGSLGIFLRGVGLDEFRMFWGIDHAKLIEGGKDILSGQGDLADSLFAAGSGISRLGTLRQNLIDEAEKLYVPRGQRRLINQSIHKLQELMGSQRSATVLTSNWVDQERAFRKADSRVAELTERVEELSRTRSRLERLRRVLPLLAERVEVIRHLDEIGDVVPLPSDFPQRLQQANTSLQLALQNIDHAGGEFGRQEEILRQLGREDPLENESEAANSLIQKLGSYRMAKTDRPKLVSRRDEQTSRARHLLLNIRPDLDITAEGQLRLLVARRARMQALSTEYERLNERYRAAQLRNREAVQRSEELAIAAATLPPVRDAGNLDVAIRETRQRGDAEAERDGKANAVEQLELQCKAHMTRLGLPQETMSNLRELPLPPVIEIARIERHVNDLENQGRIETMARNEKVGRTRILELEIETLRKQNAIPTEEDLSAARELRDRAFHLLRDHWENGRDVTEESHGLPGDGSLLDRYPDTVKKADEIADRLRAEADRVAELSQYGEEHARLGREIEGLDDLAQQRKRALEEINAQWRERWEAILIPPPPIHEAIVWRESFDRLIAEVDSLRQARQQFQNITVWIERQTGRLIDIMTELEPGIRPMGGLASTLALAEKLRNQIEQDSQAIAGHARMTSETARAIREAEAAVTNVQGEISSWQTRWKDTVHGLISDETMPPANALAELDGVEQVLEAFDSTTDYNNRIVEMDQFLDEFGSNVRALAQRLDTTAAFDEGNEENWVASLHGRLTTALQVGEQRRQARLQRDRLKGELERYQQDKTDASAAISALCAEAQCENPDELLEAYRRSADAFQYRERFSRIEDDLIQNGDGEMIADIVAEAADEDRDTIDVRLAGASADLEETERELAEARDNRSDAKAVLNTLRGPSEASERAEEIQSILARLRDDAMRYARLRMASTLLERRIDDYRRNNQAPLLRRAGELFRELTLDAFVELKADIQDDRPVIVGVRPDGKTVATRGMSEGTVDQLYLALRLAAVESSCTTNEPIPFIVDDVLVQFDDRRSEAALHVLSNLAAHTQVILFTHHGKVLECAGRLAESAEVFVHEL